MLNHFEIKVSFGPKAVCVECKIRSALPLKPYFNSRMAAERIASVIGPDKLFVHAQQ